MNTYRIDRRSRVEVNTDPQRRCYNGAHARSEMQWTEWDWLELRVPEDIIDARLKFWRELSDYAVSQRGETGRSEYRAINTKTGETR